MKIDDYIKKHGLTSWRTWPDAAPQQNRWLDDCFITHQKAGKKESFPFGETFEIYSNAERTRFVSINVTRKTFKIIHHELAHIESEWQPTHLNFELQAIG
jgi:hypothetical protein